MNTHITIQGPPLNEAKRIVVAIHGMSTTVDTLQAGFPAPAGGSITKVYWRLPVLREGADAVRTRRDSDAFNNLFVPVVEESRTELKALLAELPDRPLGLFGFSIGSLIALWGAVDNPRVKAVVTVGGVPDLYYLQHYYPDYGWSADAVKSRLSSLDVTQRATELARVRLFICHGDEDAVARWDWMAPLVKGLESAARPPQVVHYPHLGHRLSGENPAEEQDLIQLRKAADDWFVRHLEP